jgi:hypothetical protein
MGVRRPSASKYPEPSHPFFSRPGRRNDFARASLPGRQGGMLADHGQYRESVGSSIMDSMIRML